MDAITFISLENEQVEFKKELLKSCLNFTEEVCGEGLVTESSQQSLETFKKLLEIHDYEPTRVEAILPVSSNNFEVHIDKNTFQVLKNAGVEELKELLDIAENFDCEILRLACLTAIQCEFFIGNKKEFIEKFKKENEIDEEFTPEEEEEILQENQVVLQEILKTYDTNHPEYKPREFKDDEDQLEYEQEEYDQEQYEQQTKIMEQLMKEQQEEEDK